MVDGVEIVTKKSKNWIWITMGILVVVALIIFLIFKALTPLPQPVGTDIPTLEKNFLSGMMTFSKCISLCPKEQNPYFNAQDPNSFSVYTPQGCVDYCKSFIHQPATIKNSNVQPNYDTPVYRQFLTCALAIYPYNRPAAAYQYLDNSTNPAQTKMAQITKESCEQLFTQYSSTIVNLSNFTLGAYEPYDLKILEFQCGTNNASLLLKWNSSSALMTSLDFTLEKKDNSSSVISQTPLKPGETRQFPLYFEGRLKEVGISGLIKTQSGDGAVNLLTRCGAD